MLNQPPPAAVPERSPPPEAPGPSSGLSTGLSPALAKADLIGQIEKQSPAQRLLDGAPYKLMWDREADAAASKRPLDPELFAQFKLFGQQARLGLNLIKGG